MIRRLRIFARRLHSDRGTSIVEVAVGMFVLLVAVLGVIGSMGSGMTLVGHSRQRSAGVALAQERLERVRRYPYERVAINLTELPLPANDPDPANPDRDVSTDGLSYRGEQLYLRTDGAVKHIDDPFTVGLTEFSVYQYVTWVDDPSVDGTENLKRVVVVVTWKNPVNTGPSNRVEQSTLLSNGTVTLPGVSPSPSGSAGPTASPATPSSPSPASCPGDTLAPEGGSIELVSGSGATTGFTNSTTVAVRLVATDTCAPLTVELSNTPEEWAFAYVTTLTSGTPSTPTWTVPTGDGEKIVYARFWDGVGNVTTSSVSASIKLDQTAPDAPTGLLQTSGGCTTSGSNRTTDLAWTASTPDTSDSGNLLGYRLYRNIQSQGYSVVANPSVTSASDTHSKNQNPVAFMVRAYDKAGNESADSSVLTYSTNGCP